MGDFTLEIHAAGEVTRAVFSAGASLLALLRAEGHYLPAPCGGAGSCGKCRVKLLRGTLPPTPADEKALSEQELAEGYRLACRAQPTGDVAVELPRHGEGEIAAVTGYEGAAAAGSVLELEEIPLPKSRQSVARVLFGESAADLAAGVLAQCSALAEEAPGAAWRALYAGMPAWAGRAKPTLYGVAVDIGTTTLGLALVDLATGEEAARTSAVNRQREFGADVISRMIRAGEGHLGQMRDSVRGQVAAAAEELCHEAGIGQDRVIRFAIAGNTTMLHLLLGISCKTLGAFPFTPVTLEGMTFPAGELLGGGFDCPVDILPGISTYVGADITAGIYATALHRSAQPAVLLDIGTNGEMAVCREGRLLCTSTAAGPAFEGGNIQWGTGSVPGAISSVQWSEDGFAVETIGGLPPVGICGSGVLDAVWQGHRAGCLDATGRMDKSLREAGGILLGHTADGREIRLTQKDVREMQMGKSAIRSGLDILLAEAGVSPAEVGAVYLAGGFGYRIGLDSAVGIGLIPAALRGKVTAVGNAALGGAVRSLLARAGGELAAIAQEAEEFNLSENKMFNELFMANMNLNAEDDEV